MNYFRKKGFLYVISTYFVAYSNAKRQNVYCERFPHVVEVRVYGYKNKKKFSHHTARRAQKNISEKVEPLKKTSRLKAFILHFISVPAKWIRTGRQNVLNLYTHKAYYTGVFLE